MGIIQTTAPEAPTLQQQLEGTAGYFRLKMNQQYQSLMDCAGKLYEFVWANPYGFTPQQVLDVFATDAAELFAINNAYAGLVAACGGSATTAVPNGWAYTINADGTVTVTQS